MKVVSILALGIMCLVIAVASPTTSGGIGKGRSMRRRPAQSQPASILPEVAIGNGTKLHRRESPKDCESHGTIDSVGRNTACKAVHNDYNMVDYQEIVKGIPDDRMYDNYEKVLCVDATFLNVCGFVEGVDYPVSGANIKRLVTILMNDCPEARCARIDVNYEGEGRATMGMLKFDEVRTPNHCQKVCKPEDDY